MIVSWWPRWLRWQERRRRASDAPPPERHFPNGTVTPADRRQLAYDRTLEKLHATAPGEPVERDLEAANQRQEAAAEMLRRLEVEAQLKQRRIRREQPRE